MSFQAYLDNIRAKTGKGPADFFAAAKKHGLTGSDWTAGGLAGWLKKDFGLGHGHAMAIWAVFKKNGWATASRPTAKPRKPGAKPK
jgi:hypothetical protein